MTNTKSPSFESKKAIKYLQGKIKSVLDKSTKRHNQSVLIEPDSNFFNVMDKQSRLEE